jgi:hypothetical protein
VQAALNAAGFPPPPRLCVVAYAAVLLSPVYGHLVEQRERIGTVAF